MQKTLPLVLVLAFASPAAAATIGVDSTSDDAANTTDCTLRDAIAAAESDTAVDGCPAGSGADEILLPAGDYALVSGQMDVSTEITVRGAGAEQSVIIGNGSSRVFHVGAASSLTLDGLAIEGGSASEGAGLYVRGVLSATDVRFASNRATREGGAFYLNATGTATVRACSFVGNLAEGSSANGGGAIGTRGVLVVEDSSFLENRGGIYGGALMTWSSATTTVERSTFADNYAVRYGGAVIVGGGSGAVTVRNCTFARNRAGISGGAVFKDNAASLAIDHSTFVDNHAESQGGALRWSSGTRTLTASLFARNTSEGSGDDCSGGGGGDDNVMETGGCTLSGSGNQTGVSTLAGALSDNGGRTLSVPVAYGSPALGASACVDGSGVAVAVDQRGSPRPTSGCTAGAYELQVPPVLVSAVVEPAGATCTDGGYAIHTGVDLDGDGSLSAAETSSTDYLCAGLDAAQPLVEVAAEPAGASCAAGGQRVDIGYDDDASGALDAAEITSSFYVCNGADGADGQQTLVSASDEPAGASCASGGVRIDVGLDDGSGGGVARNGALEAGEIQDTRYVCDGADGMDGADGESAASALVDVTVEPEGERCPAGGTVIRAGLDDGADGETAGDGVLGEGEVDSETLVCNGAAGMDGMDGMDGAGGGCSASGRSRSGSLGALLLLALGALWRRRR